MALAAVASGYYFESYFTTADEKGLSKFLYYMQITGFVTVFLNGFLISRINLVLGYILILIVSFDCRADVKMMAFLGAQSNLCGVALSTAVSKALPESDVV